MVESVLRVELVGGGAEAEEGDGGRQAAESESSVRKVCLFSTMRTWGGAPGKRRTGARGTSISGSAGAWLK